MQPPPSSAPIKPVENRALAALRPSTYSNDMQASKYPSLTNMQQTTPEQRYTHRFNKNEYNNHLCKRFI